MTNNANLKNVLDEVKKLAKEFKAENGNSSLRIPNKDFNLWLVNNMIKQNGRIGKLEATTKILAALFCGIIIRLLIF